MRHLLIPVAAAVGLWLWAEVADARATSRGLAPTPPPAGRQAVVVLGFRNRGTRANVVNRFRVRIALRSRDPATTESVLLLCGGNVGGSVAEADLMAGYLREVRGYRGPVLVDRRSRSTWENIEHAIPHLAPFDRITVVSNPQHAERARTYLRVMAPELADRLVSADDHRFGEAVVLTTVAALVGWIDRHAWRRRSRLAVASAHAGVDVTRSATLSRRPTAWLPRTPPPVSRRTPVTAAPGGRFRACVR